MNFSFVEPFNELKPYIRTIWIFKSDRGIPLLGDNFAIPNGCPRIIINCENSIASIVNNKNYSSQENNIYFVGLRDIPVQLHTTAKRTQCIGIDFYPHGAYPIFGIPMIELANRLLTFEMIFNHWGSEVNEIFFNENNLRDKINFIQTSLLEKLKQKQLRNPAVEYCINALKGTDGLITIKELERKTGYSSRYLEMLFKNHVGLSPKVLAGIFRFQKFYKKWAIGLPYQKIKDELYSYYYDQAHFTKEFKSMTGFSPKEFTSKISNEFDRKLSVH